MALIDGHLGGCTVSSTALDTILLQRTKVAGPGTFLGLQCN